MVKELGDEEVKKILSDPKVKDLLKRKVKGVSEDLKPHAYAKYEKAPLSEEERKELLEKMWEDEEALKKVKQYLGHPGVHPIVGYQYTREGRDLTEEEMKELCEKWGVTPEDVKRICDEMWVSEKDVYDTPAYYFGPNRSEKFKDFPEAEKDPTQSVFYHRLLRANLHTALEHELGYQRPMNISIVCKGMGETDVRERIAEYPAGGINQPGGRDKQKFVEYAKEIEKERGIPIYNPKLHWHGIEVGQRKLVKWKISATHYERPAKIYDDLTGEQIQFLNNPACHQLHDDIARTHIFGLDMPHRTVERRFGREVTPETINLYFEMHNHNIGSGTLIMEHMYETDPRLVKDAYAKCITGSDEMMDALDPRFVVNINDLFPAYQAAQIKAEIGNKLFELARTPTMTLHVADTGQTRAWVGQQASLAFLSCYRIPAGEAVTSDFVYTVKHGDNIFMGNRLPWRRAKMVNSPGGVSVGYAADINQAMRSPECQDPFDPPRLFVESVAMESAYYDIGYLHNYLAGGSSGWAQVMITQGYCSDIDEEFSYNTLEAVTVRCFMPLNMAPLSLDSMYAATEQLVKYGIEFFDKQPIEQETLYGHLQRVKLIAAVCGASSCYFQRNPIIGHPGFDYALLLLKENYNRLGFYAQDAPHQQGFFYSFSLLGEVGSPLELRGFNCPTWAWSVAYGSAGVAYCNGPHYLCGHGYSCNPVVKVAFADPNLLFDFRYVRKMIAKGAVREFMPAGERDPVIPPH
ncbi:MAG: coenzyme-B sulfoethylthiotransferase subunit alpha [Candidatus Methanospirareceae archaeon]